jgi:predicted nucleic acid-binding protein
VKVFLDTNVLVYLFDAGAPAKQAAARELLATRGEAGEVVLSTQVLQEFYVAVTRKLAKPLEEQTAADALRDLAAFPIVQIDSDMVFSAAQRSRADRMSFWDALIVEAALSSGAALLCSEDLQAGRKFDGLEVVNPFAS